MFCRHVPSVYLCAVFSDYLKRNYAPLHKVDKFVPDCTELYFRMTELQERLLMVNIILKRGLNRNHITCMGLGFVTFSGPINIL
jgi:hypothetical protein